MNWNILKTINYPVLNILPVGVSIWDIATQTIVYANNKSRETWGMSDTADVERLIATGSYCKLDRSPLELEESSTYKAMVSNRIETGVVGVKRGDGITWVNVIALPTEIEGWRVITTVTSDITAVIVAQEERQHLAALQEEMLQNVSHELRTPLTVIIGLSEILEKGFLGEIAEQQKAAAKTILQRAVDMHHLTNAMIALIAPVFKERFSVPDVVMSVVLAAGATANRLGIDIQYDYHNGLKIHGDLNLVKAAIAALVDNAIKFSQRGGIVVIAVKRDNLGLSVIVTDQGIGIAPENRERIFNRFVQISDGTTRLYGGVGLGLSVVERAIEAHGGRVDLVSEVNEGSTFTLWLPYGSDSD